MIDRSQVHIPLPGFYHLWLIHGYLRHFLIVPVGITGKARNDAMHAVESDYALEAKTLDVFRVETSIKWCAPAGVHRQLNGNLAQLFPRPLFRRIVNPCLIEDILIVVHACGTLVNRHAIADAVEGTVLQS